MDGVLGPRGVPSGGIVTLLVLRRRRSHRPLQKASPSALKYRRLAITKNIGEEKQKKIGQTPRQERVKRWIWRLQLQVTR